MDKEVTWQIYRDQVAINRRRKERILSCLRKRGCVILESSADKCYMVYVDPLNREDLIRLMNHAQQGFRKVILKGNRKPVLYLYY